MALEYKMSGNGSLNWIFSFLDYNQDGIKRGRPSRAG